MTHWSGNNYNRAKELPKFLAKLNPKELQEYGKKQLPKSFMSNYGHDEMDKKYLATHNQRYLQPYTALSHQKTHYES